MTRTLLKLALGAALAILASPSDIFAGRGGGRGGGYGGGSRGSYGGGGESRGSYGGGSSANHSPSFSQPRSSSSGSQPQGNAASGNRSSTGSQAESGSRSPYGNTASAGDRNQSPSNTGAAAAGAGAANRNQSPSNAGAAAAGAGAANRNQSPSNAGAAAAGAGAANRNQSPSNAGAAAAGAGYANRNEGPSNAGAAAAGAGYANRNQSGNISNAGAAAAGAGYANRNQNPYPNAGAAAVGAGYANRNQYDQYHPGMTNGYWNGNYGAMGVGTGGYGGVGAWGAGSPMYGYGYSSYANPYAAGYGTGVAVPAGIPSSTNAAAQPAVAQAYDYSQPLNTAAAPPAQDAATQATSTFDQARNAFRSNDYATALQLVQQALGPMPNDTTMHEFLALVLFAQGKYEQAAAPLYAVLSVGPGWDWTTLISNYSDANLYTEQIRALEAYIKANPSSAQAQFVLAYHYITQGHGDAAAGFLKNVVTLQPNDTLSAQLLKMVQPASAATPAPAPAVDVGKLTGNWVATAPQNAQITLTIQDDGGFKWTVAAPGKPPASLSGTSKLADGVLTLAAQNSPVGTLTGQVVRQDDTHFTFRATGAPADDPGLKFAR